MAPLPALTRTPDPAKLAELALRFVTEARGLGADRETVQRAVRDALDE